MARARMTKAEMAEKLDTMEEAIEQARDLMDEAMGLRIIDDDDDDEEEEDDDDDDDEEEDDTPPRRRR